MSDSRAEFNKISRPLAQNLIAYAMAEGRDQGITDVKVSISSLKNHKISVEKGEVAESTAGTVSRVEITLFAGDRNVSLQSNSLDEQTLKDAILKNIKIIHLVPGNADAILLDQEKVYKGPMVDFDLFDQNPPDQAALVAYAVAAEKAALAEKGAKGTRAVSVSRSSQHALVMATNGMDFQGGITSYSASAQVVAKDAGGMQIDGEDTVARYFADMKKPEELGKTAALNAISKLSPMLPATGDMPIVLDPDTAANFFGAVYASIKGDAVHRGTTFMKGKVGQQVMSKGVTIVDDPTIKRGLMSGCVDSAGVETKKITFIEDGVLKIYNLNLMQARQLGMEPTGREDSLRGATNGTTNAQVLPGVQTPDELMADIKEGVYIKGFKGGTIDVNNGTYSRPAYGKLIKNGKITDVAVDGFIVAGNLKEMFMNVALANDTPALPGDGRRFAAPTTRINGVRIAGK